MNNHIVDEWVKICKGRTRYKFLREHLLDDRVRRLFAVACCREFWDTLIDERSRKAVETAELFADGLTTQQELRKARNDAWSNIATSASASAALWVAASASSSAAYAAYYVYTADQYKRQGLILAQMYPITFNEQWITSTTKSLAQQIYDKKDFSLMPILADALQDVNCNEEILEHLRSKGPFYKGNYIIDVLTGKRTIKASTS